MHSREKLKRTFGPGYGKGLSCALSSKGLPLYPGCPLCIRVEAYCLLGEIAAGPSFFGARSYSSLEPRIGSLPITSQRAGPHSPSVRVGPLLRSASPVAAWTDGWLIACQTIPGGSQWEGCLHHRTCPSVWSCASRGLPWVIRPPCKLEGAPSEGPMLRATASPLVLKQPGL